MPWAARPSLRRRTTKRFGVTQAAERLDVPVVGGEGQHQTVADLVSEGYTVFTF